MIRPISRFKDVLVGGHRRSPVIRGGAAAEHWYDGRIAGPADDDDDEKLEREVFLMCVTTASLFWEHLDCLVLAVNWI